MKQSIYRYPLYVMIHPYKGFWELKSEGAGRLHVGAALVLLAIMTNILQKQYAGFLVNYNDPRYLNSIDELKYILLPFVLWSVSNWAVTTLLEGEGKFKEILLATSYAMAPLVLINLPMILISRFMTRDETAFYYLMLSFSLLWFIYLLFVGMMTVHQYSARKNAATMLLTVVVMGIILFLGSLVFSMIQQLFVFVYDVYRELIFRM